MPFTYASVGLFYIEQSDDWKRYYFYLAHCVWQNYREKKEEEEEKEKQEKEEKNASSSKKNLFMAVKV